MANTFLMNRKTFNKLSVLDPTAPERADTATKIFLGAPYSKDNNHAINALMAIVTGNNFKDETLNKLQLEGLSDKVVQEIARKLYKQFTKEVRQFIPDNMPNAVKNAYKVLVANAQQVFPDIEHRIPTSWLYGRINAFLQNNSNDEYKYNRVVFLLSQEMDNYVFGGLKEIGLNREYATKFLPLGNEIGNLLKALKESKVDVADKSSTPASMESSTPANGDSAVAEETVSPTAVGYALQESLNAMGTTIPNYLRTLNQEEATTTPESVAVATEGPNADDGLNVSTPLEQDAEITNSDLNEVLDENMVDSHLAVAEACKGFVQYLYNVFGVSATVYLE